MDEQIPGPRRSNVSPNSSVALLLIRRLQSHAPLDDWYFTHHEHERSVHADEQDEQDVQNEKEFEQELEEFDKGDDLEADLAASLSTTDRASADANCLAFDEHVAQVGSWPDRRSISHTYRTMHLSKFQLQLHFWSCSSS